MDTKTNGHADSARQTLIEDIRRLSPSLRAFGISLSGNGDRADDLVQETLYRALSNINSFEAGTNLSAWLFTILRNLFHSEYRKRRREVEWNPVFENTIHFSDGLADQNSSIEFVQVAQYIACLPPDQRDAIMAVGYLGLSYEETANRIDCEVGTVKSRVNRAREQLMQWIETAKVESVDVTALRSATRGVPPTDPYYPIAKAYETMFADVQSVGKVIPRHENDADKHWADLVASGALDANDEYSAQQNRYEED